MDGKPCKDGKQMKVIKQNNVYAEVFNSQQELHKYLLTNEPVFDVRHNRIAPDYEPSNPSWSGYKNGQQLMEDFLSCHCNYKSIQRIQQGIRSDKTAIKRVKYLSVVGGVPIVPIVLAGQPLNMLNTKRVKAPAKIINLYVSVNGSGDLSKSELEA